MGTEQVPNPILHHAPYQTTSQQTYPNMFQYAQLFQTGDSNLHYVNVPSLYGQERFASQTSTTTSSSSSSSSPIPTQQQQQYQQQGLLRFPTQFGGGSSTSSNPRKNMKDFRDQ